MRTSTKVWLFTATALVLIGALCLGYTILHSHGNPGVLNNRKFETKTVTISEEFRSIEIHSHTEDIRFVPSDDGTCRVEFFEEEKLQHTAEVRNDTLTIGVTDEREWMDYIGTISYDSPSITVYLPGTRYDALVIDESTGTVELPKDFIFASAEITASTGSVDCAATVDGLLRIALTTGDIRLAELTAGELDLTVSTGAVELRSVGCLGSLHIDVSTGKTTLTDVNCRTLTSTGSTGSITMENVLAADKISIERSTGDVKFKACDADEIYVKTDTGDVTGTLLSSKVFLTESDTGRIDVPKSVTGGKCEITTDTGDIKLSIE